MMKIVGFQALLTFCLISGLTACKSPTDDVQTKMQEIKSGAPLPMEPPPSFLPIPSYAYAGFQLKSPFVPTSIANDLRTMAGKRVHPNFARPLQPLEEYALEELYMKGTMNGAARGMVALISTPDRQVEQVQVGNYLGKNHGRIVRITPDQISLIEIVPDGQEGYIERPRTLVLRSDVKN